MTRQMFLTSVVPIGLLFSGTLWFGNASYTYLSVSFIQMLKALMPAAVFTVGCFFGTEKFGWPIMTNMVRRRGWEPFVKGGCGCSSY